MKITKQRKILFIVILALLMLLSTALVFLIQVINSQNNKTEKDINEQVHFNLNKPSVFPTIPISLIFTGDVIPARSVNSRMVRLNDFSSPFEKTADFLKEADLTVINLEAPLVDDCPVTDTGMIFCGNPRFVEGLLFAGVDLVTLANNHASNYGQAGVDNTVSLLQKNSIEAVGFNNIVYQEIKGIKFAFLGFNGVSPLVDYLGTIDKEKIKTLVSQAKNEADFVVVLFHWGQEYSPFPKADSVAPFDPIEIAHFTIDSGADLIVGNHPHVIQGFEFYREKPIFYALGNFVFDQMWSIETRTGVLLKTNLIGNKVDSFSFYPVRTDNFTSPYFLEGEEKKAVLEQIKSLN